MGIFTRERGANADSDLAAVSLKFDGHFSVALNGDIFQIVRMTTQTLPSEEEMTRAFLAADATYEGVFFTAVKTTGIFCRPSCNARKPKPENVTFYARPADALNAGFRPCKRCHPMEMLGNQPDWIRRILEKVEEEPGRRWKDADIRRLGLNPARVRRWFKDNHGITFHAYSRARRLGEAFGNISSGASVTSTAFDSGFESLSGFNDAVRRVAGNSPTAVDNLILKVSRFSTELGPMMVAASEEAVYLLEFTDRRALPRQLETLSKRTNSVYVPGSNPLIERLSREVGRYFETGIPRFGVPVRSPGTPFQQDVWNALRQIPPGETRSYSEIAKEIGKHSAVRAVARANGDNRLAIIIPCHRVIGADGSLTGYGGGLWRKKRLLELEAGIHSPARK